MKPAADFIVARGPSTPQERWEEEGGYSPSTIAAEIAGLVSAAASPARTATTPPRPSTPGVADDWQRHVKDVDPHDDRPATATAVLPAHRRQRQPQRRPLLEINNGGGTYDERAIVDGGFLDLVRLGVKRADDPFVVGSLPERGLHDRVDTPHGPMWYRYNHDGYGEKADGSPYDGTGVGPAVAAAHRRARRVRARRRAPRRRRTCARWRGPPTPAG